jgi:hypothetical protein
LSKRLFPESEAETIVSRMHLYEPNLLWVGESRIAVANVSPTSEFTGAPTPEAVVDTGVNVPSGRTWQPSERLWFAGLCGCGSPGGSQITSTAPSGKGFVLRVSRPNGSEPRTVASVPGCWNDGSFVAAVTGLQFADGGDSLVYQSDCSEPAANLYLLDSDGVLRRLTDTRAQQTAPELSPNGREIAYIQAPATGLSCQGCPASVWLINANGTDARALVAPQQSVWDANPSWSPNGTLIVFSRSTTNTGGELYVVPAKGGKPRDLHIAGQFPVWGPTRVAYIGGQNLSGPHLSI